VLVERDHEMRVLSQVAAAGLPHLVLVTGEAGAGKSRLVAEFCDALPENWTVERIAADRFAADREDRGSHPVCALLEDIQSSDPTVIDGLAQRITVMPGGSILVLATYRLGSHPPGSRTSAAVARLLRAERAFELRLTPISREGVKEMVAAMRPQAPVDDAFVDALAARTGGNPFFVEAVLQSDDAEVPWTVMESVLARLATLDDEHVRLACLVACCRSELNEAVLDVLGIPNTSVRALVDAGLAERTDDGVRLRHSLVADAIEARLDPDEVRSNCRELASALERSEDTRTGLLASLWSRAGEASRAALHAWAGADGLAANRMYASAADLYEIAVADLPSDPVEKGSALERAATAAANSGRRDEALEWATSADRAYRDGGEEWRASAVWLNPALRLVSVEVPGDASLPTDSDIDLVRRASDALARCAYDDANALSRAAATEAAANGNGWTFFEALALTCSAGDPVWADGCAARFVDDRRQAGDRPNSAMGLAARGLVALSLGYIGGALDFARSAVAEGAGEPETFIWTHVRLMLVGALAAAGRLDETEQLASELRSPDQPMSDLFVDAALFDLDIARGDLVGARRRMDLMAPAWSWGMPTLYLATGLTGRAHIALVEGDFETSLRELDEADSVRPELLGPHLADRLMFAGLAAEAIGDGGRLDATCKRALALARDASGHANQAVAHYVTAIRARASGDNDLAFTRFEAAAAAWERAPRRVLAGETLCDAAEAAVSASDAVKARMASDRAERTAGELGPVRNRVSAVRSAIPGLTVLGPRELSALTTRELEIAKLLAAGWTNQEIAATLFVSEKTVRNALTFVFAKLGVSRRTEAMALLHKLGVSPSKDG
jgi:DNA-binding CsgD family transcriptional regulator/tetratricopeptide (TPR) repeat protein